MAIELLPKSNETATACPTCGCPGRWLDHFGVAHCRICQPAPLKAMVQRNQFLFSGDWIDLDDSEDHQVASARQNRCQGPFQGFNPFDGSPLPAGVFFPVADRPEFVKCDHVGRGLVRERCTNQIWDRVLCAGCGRLLDLVDAVLSFDEI